VIRPTLSNTRRRDRVYRYDYCEADHVRLLDAILKLPCRVVISGYDSELYNAYLHDWNTTTFKAETQCGIREERLWFNFKPPSWLHDERYLGRNFRERQTIKRRLQRLETRIVAFPPQELCALFRRLDNFCQERGQPWRQPKTEEASHYTEREAKLVNHVIQGHITQKDLSTKNGSALQLSLLEGLELELPSGTTNACAEKTLRNERIQRSVPEFAAE
jgi:hypothetical protein